METYVFHLMPWPYLDPDFAQRYETVWVDFSNQHYDPERGVAVYNQYLDQLEYADQLGYDGVVVNEHHQTSYGNMPSPNIMAAMLARRTRRAKIAIMGNALPLYDHPLRVAEEVAMLDVVTGGRIISGFVRGIGCEYYVFQVNPAHSYERFREAHDLIVQAWTRPGPFEFRGKFYDLPYVNTWPRPVQKPHPPIWIPSSGSLETIRWAVAHRYPYVQTTNPARAVLKNFELYREEAERQGFSAGPEYLGWSMPIYVAETDAQALAEAKPHLEYYWRSFKMSVELRLPPGYSSVASTIRTRQIKALDTRTAMTAEDLLEQEMAIIGSPATVRDRLAEYYRTMRFGKILALMHFGTMPHHLALKNLELYAREVMPFVRGLGPS
ncbi:MAG: LLM class flavin-dependent oxidoreductase [Firmicutes bacterium]|nr:LLM class flavin-dependent oxidoreductase [Bacillota bacterium]